MTLWLLRLFGRFRELEKCFDQIGDRLEQKTDEARVLLDGRDRWQIRCVGLEGERNHLSERIAQLELDATGLRSSLADAQSENVRLQDRLESALEEKARIWGLYEKAADGERTALRMTANEHWKTRYGTTPWPEAPSPADHAVRDPNASREALGRSYDLPSQRLAKQAGANVKAWIDEIAGKV